MNSNNTSGDGGRGPGGGDGGSGSGLTADAPVTAAGNIQIIVEPNGNKGSELVDAINAAQHNVYMTMYELDHEGVITALTSRYKAGVDVKVILDGSTTTRSFNMSAYTTLMGAGIPTVWSSSSFTYTHEKTVMIDGSVAWIMTMNANTSSPEDNREYLAIDSAVADVSEATAIFQADFAMQAITPSGALVVANNNARPDLYALLNEATSTLDVEVEELSDTDEDGIVDGIVAAAKRGVTVHVVVGNAGPDATSDNDIATAGGKVVMTGPTSDDGTPTNPYIHAKAILIDCSATTCKKGFVGSENFSAGSLGYNRELGLIFTDATQLAKVKTAIDTDYAAGVAP
ncbi:MAG TPA: phospholipase D-like domain-containing protein [Gemmatimonadaceae bacterium]|nr:phospholipase D-like domain-containing protein [Gemmatimonadaceae bacterium]